MSILCPHCGSTKNPSGATVCGVCSRSMPASPYVGTKSSSISTPTTVGFLTTSSGRKFRLSDTSATLIGGRGCAVLLSDPGVADQHARVIPTGGGFTIEAVLGQVYLDGNLISTQTPLVSGMNVKLGGANLVYSGPSLTGSLVPPASIPKPVVTTPASVVIPTITPSTISTPKRKSTANLTGHIVMVDGPHTESPDVDWAGLLLRGSFGLVLLPFMCWQPAIVMPFLLYGFGQRNRTVPVRYLRVEDSAGIEHVVKMKGDPVRGILHQGDDASFWGRWDSGTLMMTRALNQKTNADVRLKPVLQRRGNQIILGLIIITSLIFWISAGM